MATYQGTISGTGNTDTRENEITADNVAIFRNFAIGYDLDTRDAGGIIYDPKHDFYAWVDGYEEGVDNTDKFSNILHISDGVGFAYGYFGAVGNTTFTFLPPAVQQYHLVYLELDRSVIPNTATIKTKSNQDSSKVLANTFRRDQLSTVKTGVHQIPLWLIKITSKGIRCENLEGVDGVDLRKRREYIQKAENSENATNLIWGGTNNLSIGENVTCPNPPLDIDEEAEVVANCWFVQTIAEQKIKQ